jgi:hypothetical protein
MTGPAGPGPDRDSVVRRRAFEQEHPEISITPPGPGRLLWTARAGGKILCAEYWLDDLLDDLAWLEGREGGEGHPS